MCSRVNSKTLSFKSMIGEGIYTLTSDKCPGIEITRIKKEAARPCICRFNIDQLGMCSRINSTMTVGNGNKTSVEWV